MVNACAPTLLGDLREVWTLFDVETFDGIRACACLAFLSTADTLDALGQFATLLRPAGKSYACVKAVGETGWLDEPDAHRWCTVWPRRGSPRPCGRPDSTSTGPPRRRSWRCGAPDPVEVAPSHRVPWNGSTYPVAGGVITRGTRDRLGVDSHGHVVR